MYVISNESIKLKWISNNVPPQTELPERLFDPAHPLGEMGKPVIFEGDMKTHADALYHKNAFNLLASDMIAFNRSLPDVRSQQ